MPLTDRQRAVYQYIVNYREEHRCSPTIPEIQKAFGWASPNGVMGHLKALESKGCIRRADRGSRWIEVVAESREPVFHLPMFGQIPAGPATAVEVSGSVGEAALDASTLGFQPRDGCYVLQVTGNSMEGAGIYSGDHVVVNPHQSPHNGDVVAAVLTTESTLKRFRQKGRAIWLEAEYADHREKIGAEFTLQGVVRTLIRRF